MRDIGPRALSTFFPNIFQETRPGSAGTGSRPRALICDLHFEHPLRETSATSARTAEEGLLPEEPAEVLILIGQMCIHLRALMFRPTTAVIRS